jgi:predicted metal-binding membrane protein
VLLFRTMQRQRGARGTPMVPTAAFVGGYLAVWTLAGIAADLTYMAAQAIGPRLHAGDGVVPVIGGTIVVLAGLYQFSPLKHVCLARCRSPFHMILHGWREGRLGALRMGASHGAYCLGCCWGIMAVLFVVGLMNLAWMAALSILIVAEKLAPRGAAMGRLVGIVFIALGVCVAVQPQRFPASGLQPSDATPMTSMTP